MTKITIDRAVVEQALHVATGAGYPVALIAALKAALAEPVPPIGKASTDVGVPVYVLKKAEPPCNPSCAPGYCYCEPVQEPVAVHQFRKRGCIDWFDGHPDHTDGGGPYVSRTLYLDPPQRKED